MIPTKIGPYLIEKRLGRGSYGTVYKAIHEKTTTNVAIKIIEKCQLDHDQSRLRFSREVSLLQRIDHPFVPRFYQLIEDSEYFYLVMEYVSNGDLVSLHRPTDEYTAKRIFIQLIVILEYLHKNLHIAHRDLKAENIMLDKHSNIRLIDYGLSNCFSDNNPQLKTACGSAHYIPPEVVKKQRYTSSVDVWSAGILLYYLMVGYLPFDDENVSNVLQKIVYADPYFPPTISPDLADLLKKMLTKQPENRITIDKIKEHPWFSLSEHKRIALYCNQNKNNSISSSTSGNINMTGNCNNSNNNNSNNSNNINDNCNNNNNGNNALNNYYGSNFAAAMRSSTSITSSCRMISVCDTQIDPDIVNDMKKYGIETSNLKQQLFMKNYSETTAVYEMLRRQKLIEEMKFEVKISSRTRSPKISITIVHNPNSRDCELAGLVEGNSNNNVNVNNISNSYLTEDLNNNNINANINNNNNNDNNESDINSNSLSSSCRHIHISYSPNCARPPGPLSPRIVSKNSMDNIQKRFSHEFNNSAKKRFS